MHGFQAGVEFTQSPTQIARTQLESASSWCMFFRAVSSCRLLEVLQADLQRISLLAKFNHQKRSWLVLWEAGVVVELPPWVLVAYPSSLFFHFNIDIQGK